MNIHDRDGNAQDAVVADYQAERKRHLNIYFKNGALDYFSDDSWPPSGPGGPRPGGFRVQARIRRAGGPRKFSTGRAWRADLGYLAPTLRAGRAGLTLFPAHTSFWKQYSSRS